MSGSDVSDTQVAGARHNVARFLSFSFTDCDLARGRRPLRFRAEIVTLAEPGLVSGRY